MLGAPCHAVAAGQVDLEFRYEAASCLVRRSRADSLHNPKVCANKIDANLTLSW